MVLSGGNGQVRTEELWSLPPGKHVVAGRSPAQSFTLEELGVPRVNLGGLCSADKGSGWPRFPGSRELLVCSHTK